MKLDLNYRNALIKALVMHVLLIGTLLVDTSSERPVLTKETQTTKGMDLPSVDVSKQEAVKAVTVDNKAVQETINKLKQERAAEQQAIQNRQNELKRQAEAAKQERIREQQKIVKLKEEADRIAIEHKKQAEREKKRLEELEAKKVIEAKKLEALKQQKEKLVKQKEELAKQQEKEAKKLAELNKKKAQEQEQAKKEQAAKDKLAQEAKAAATAEQARANANERARIAGEVDKYKALIVNAIGQHWILPENVDGTLSSQFRIRLAPDGAVIEVTLTRSSGDALLDRSAQTAIYKAAPLPVPTDADTFNLFRDISLTVRPEQVRG